MADAYPHSSGHVRLDTRIVTQYARKIGPTAFTVYAVLSKFADNTTRRCYPSIATICELTGMGRNSVFRAIRRLESVGLVAVERGRTRQGDSANNVYTLLALPGDRKVSHAEVAPDVPRGGAKNEPPVVLKTNHGGAKSEHELSPVNYLQDNYVEGHQALQPRAPVAPAAPAPARTPRKKPAQEDLPQTAAPRVRDPNLDHPAVRAYRNACKLTPNEHQRAEIAAQVADVPRWEEVIGKWLLMGYRKNNVAGMLDWYQNGVPGRNQGHGNNGVGWGRNLQVRGANERYRCSPRETDAERALRDAEWDCLVRRAAAESGGDAPLPDVQGQGLGSL